ncbi:MAG: hypothetical protein EOP09_02625, partial [Proteobacteria bacterium]
MSRGLSGQSGRIQVSQFQSTNQRALVSLALITLNGISGFYFTFRSEGAWVLLGQVQLFILVWHSFSLVHSCGHGTYFKSKLGNLIAGHLASIFVLIPFYGWKYHHHLHHVWVGHESQDPSNSAASSVPSSGVMAFLDFCWKFWIPVFSLYYAVTNFWLTGHLFKHVKQPEKRRRIWFSIFWMWGVHLVVLSLIGPRFLLALLVPQFLYLVTSDVILVAQHLFLDRPDQRYAGTRPLGSQAQDVYSRTIHSWKWIDRVLLLNIHLHNAHHAYPQVAHYHL